MANSQINIIEAVTEIGRNDFSFSFDARFFFKNPAVGFSNKTVFSTVQNMVGSDDNWHSPAINCNTFFIHGVAHDARINLVKDLKEGIRSKLNHPIVLSTL